MRFRALVLLAVTWCFAGPAATFGPRLYAQTQEVQEEINGSSLPRLTVREAAHALLVLNTPLDVRAFGKNSTGKAAFGEIYEQLDARGLDTAWLVDRHAMGRGRPGFDFYDAPVDLSRLPRFAPVGMVVEEIFNQAKIRGIVVVRPGFLEVTTREAFLTRPRLGFLCWTTVAFGAR